MGLSDHALGDVRAQLISDARRSLLAEKDALFQELGDVAFEHDADKRDEVHRRYEFGCEDKRLHARPRIPLCLGTQPGFHVARSKVG